MSGSDSKHSPRGADTTHSSGSREGPFQPRQPQAAPRPLEPLEVTASCSRRASPNASFENYAHSFLPFPDYYCMGSKVYALLVPILTLGSLFEGRFVVPRLQKDRPAEGRGLSTPQRQQAVSPGNRPQTGVGGLCSQLETSGGLVSQLEPTAQSRTRPRQLQALKRVGPGGLLGTEACAV